MQQHTIDRTTVEDTLHPWRPGAALGLDDALLGFIERYRAHYLDYFLHRYRTQRRPGYRGGYFNINSVTGEPYDHRYCYSWTDGRSLGELAVSHLAGLGDRQSLREYCDHLYEALRERYALNGYFPHVVQDDTNLAADHPMNVPIGNAASSFAHVFVLNGMCQYGLVFGASDALELGLTLLGQTRVALQGNTFLEGERPRPKGQRAQGPFMITLGAIADVLETMEVLWGRESAEFGARAEALVGLGQSCVDTILAHHHRPTDHAFWEVSQGGEGVPSSTGQVVTDPGHTIEFTGFAVRFARYMEPAERERVLGTALAVFVWAASHGFHPTRDLIYKNIDRDTGEPIRNELVNDIHRVVSPEVAETRFRDTEGPEHIATFPWWVPMELIAAGSILRHRDPTGEVDRLLLRAIRGLFEYYPNPRIDGLCYQNIGDGFFDWIDIPPATASLDLMHSHRSMRVFLREVAGRPS